MRIDRNLSITTCLAVLIVTASMCIPSGSAHAFSVGITGLSGKNQGLICNTCHGGGTAPLVALEGPTTVPPGATVNYRFVVTSQNTAQVAAGLDVAVMAGQLMVDNAQGARVEAGEVVHNAPKNNLDGVASWDFTWTAPSALGTVTMFAAGNSVNRNNVVLGDRASATTLVIEVAAAVDTPSPSPSPTPTRTPTLGPIPCVGDCDNSGRVAVNELVVGVNIALDRAVVATCASFDRDSNRKVSVNELVSGVNALLRNCDTNL